MARKQSTIIIGAGLSGLSAGCFAQKAGYNSRIFEHHHVPGGLAACWKRKGYLIDGGIHFIYGYRPGFKSYELLKALGVGSPDLYVPMEEYCTYVDEDSKVRIKIGKDVDKFAREAKALAPQDTGVIDEIVKGIRGMQGTDITSIGVSQPEGVLAKIQLLWQSRKIWKYMGKKYSQPVGEYAQLIKTPWLKSMVNNIFNPEVPVWFLFMLVSNVAINQMAYTKNGCQSFVQEIEKHYKSLGGQVQYKSTVAKILTENGKVYGIQLANGEKHTADYVISAGDGYNTIYNLLEGKYTNSRIDNRYKTWETCRPFFFASYGINREFKGEPVYTKVSLKEPIKYGPLEAKDFCLRIMNYGNFAPPGKTTIQVNFESDWEYWHQLREKNKSEYAAEKQRISDNILGRLENYYPGIGQQVEMSDMATPSTTHRFTLNRYGSWGGWTLSSKVFQAKIEKTLPGLNNFYMAGQWSSSGGVLPSLYSGKIAVDLMQKNY